MASVAIVGGAAILAFVAGLLSAFGAVLPAAMLAALLIGVAVIASPRLHIYLAMIVALVVTGILEFFASFGQANWLSSLIAGSMLLTAFAKCMSPQKNGASVSGLVVLILMYLVVLAFASILNGVPIPQAIVGIRNYVPYLGVAALLIWGGLPTETCRSLLKMLLAIALLQVPFALLQFLVVGKWRALQRGAVGRSDEAVVGTFGGNILTGGYTGEMAAFLVMAMVLVAALRRERLVGAGTAAAMLLAMLVPILVAETKVTLVLIPILFGVAFFSDIRRNPRFAFVAIFFGSILVSVVAATYYVKYWGGESVAAQQMGYSFDPDFMVTPDHRGRVGTVVHWYKVNVVHGELIQALVGHGVGSSLEGSLTIGLGTAVRKFGLGLDAHAMSRLLWDGGVLAFIVFVAIGLRTCWVALRIANRHLPAGAERAAATFCGAAALGMTMMIPYQMSILGGSAMQFLFWFVVGYTEMLRRRCLAEDLKKSKNGAVNRSSGRAFSPATQSI